MAKMNISGTIYLLWLCLFSITLLGQGAQVEPSPASQRSIKIEAQNQTADLTLLINETLTINNKTIQANVTPSVLKDDWTFDMVEYDLMDFLRDLSARYQLANKTAAQEAKADLEADLEAKKLKPPATTVNDKASIDPVVSSTLASNVVEKASLAPVTSAKLPISVSNNIEEKVAAVRPTFSTAQPSPLSTSLASADHEIAESSWQYGIFDRFTRAKSTTTTAAPDLPVRLDEDGKLDTRNFNHDECGLRNYDDSPSMYPEQFDSDSSGAIKDLSQRRQRLPAPPIARRKQQHLDVSSSVAGDYEYDKHGGSYDDGPYEESYPSSADSGSHDDSEFNLASRRHWMQQQLGNTLQILGFNATTHPGVLADYFNDTGLMRRENMMKMSSKLGKSADLDAATINSAEPTDVNKSSLNNEKLAGRQDELKLEARVIGGSDARLGDSPWSVSLQALVARPGTGGVEYRHYCGGTIISEYYILTAAHCLDFMVGRESRLFVVIGDLNWRMSAASLYGRRFAIDKLIIHSGYKSTAFGHDIGLIRTKESMKPLKVNGRYIINSVCLPEKNVEHSGEAELVGWGLFSNRNEMADSLQIAEVPILPRPLCVDLYKRRTGLIQWLIGIELITEKQVCAGTFGRGICQGDSGSALVYNQKLPKREAKQRQKLRIGNSDESRATIIGIVAFGGIRRCSYQSLPGVYMQTSKYMDWIVPRIQV